MEILITVLCCLLFILCVQIRSLYLSVKILISEVRKLVEIRSIVESISLIQSEIKSLKDEAKNREA